MLKLHLIRHGKTERIASSGGDFDRKLIERGEMQSQAIGRHLQTDGSPVVYCSSAVRTTQTLEEIRKFATLPEAHYRRDLYLCGTREFLNIIWKEERRNELLFVGHNFGISDLVVYFTDNQIELSTGEYVVIGFETDRWKETSTGLGKIIYRYRL